MQDISMGGRVIFLSSAARSQFTRSGYTGGRRFFFFFPLVMHCAVVFFEGE